MVIALEQIPPPPAKRSTARGAGERSSSSPAVSTNTCGRKSHAGALVAQQGHDRLQAARRDHVVVAEAPQVAAGWRVLDQATAGWPRRRGCVAGGGSAARTASRPPRSAAPRCRPARRCRRSARGAGAAGSLVETAQERAHVGHPVVRRDAMASSGRRRRGVLRRQCGLRHRVDGAAAVARDRRGARASSHMRHGAPPLLHSERSSSTSRSVSAHCQKPSWRNTRSSPSAATLAAARAPACRPHRREPVEDAPREDEEPAVDAGRRPRWASRRSRGPRRRRAQPPNAREARRR